jgi:hypothetical protein
MRRSMGLLLLAAVLASGSPAVRAEDPPPPLVVADFEDAASIQAVNAGNGTSEIVEAPDKAGGHVLKWGLDDGKGKLAFVELGLDTPPDLAKHRFLSFRIRLEGDRPGGLYVRLGNDNRSCLDYRVRGVGPQWKTFTVPLDSMDPMGKFDPAAVQRVEFIVFDGKAGTYLLDDVVLSPSAPAAAPPAKSPAPAAGKKGRLLVADFEAPESIDFVDDYRSSAARVPAGGKEKGNVLAWTMPAEAKTAYIELYAVPADVREMRTLRFRVRADKPVTETMYVRLETNGSVCLDGEVTGIGKDWKNVEIRLPDMDVMGSFDPRFVRDLAFVFFKPPPAVVQIDDIELEPGPGGWRASEAEVLVKAFGEGRAKKVVKIPTKHFEVFTDSAAAQGKFPKALEAIYDFAKDKLGMPEMEESLPIYIFQNSTLYYEFCVRYAKWPKERAEASAGHGSGRYFTTYYQSPDAAVVAHELTHSLFHRTRGAMGGSWLQEGVAVYLENLWLKQSAAEIFSANLRSGQFVHLDEFMKIPSLLDSHDPKGGPLTADRLYAQSGAFYEFLVRGPLAEQSKKAIPILAKVPKRDEEQGAFVAGVYGRSLEEIEKEWIAWGSNPPKAK